MLIFLFKTGVTFFVLTLLTLLSIKVLSDFINEGIIDEKHEEKIAEVTVKALTIFGSMTALIVILWVFIFIWSL